MSARVRLHSHSTDIEICVETSLCVRHAFLHLYTLPATAPHPSPVFTLPIQSPRIYSIIHESRARGGAHQAPIPPDRRVYRVGVVVIACGSARVLVLYVRHVSRIAQLCIPTESGRQRRTHQQRAQKSTPKATISTTTMALLSLFFVCLRITEAQSLC